MLSDWLVKLKPVEDEPETDTSIDGSSWGDDMILLFSGVSWDEAEATGAVVSAEFLWELLIMPLGWLDGGEGKREEDEATETDGELVSSETVTWI